jgi:hypothetical protein
MAAAVVLVVIVTVAAVLLTRKRPAGPLRVNVSLGAAGPGGSGTGGRWSLAHGLNRAPTCQQTGLSLALELPALGTTLVRTHDARVLDIFSIFPDPTADPEATASYNFTAGDVFFKEILDAGQRAYLRLGVSWPPGSPPLLPPVPAWSLCPSAELMARISLRTVQHYNDAAFAGGFANKTIHSIEVWNEPDGLNPLMFCGTPADFYALYNATAVTLKRYDPSLRIGGPAVASPSSAAFGLGFVNFVVASGAPLDFFSWHSYGTSAADVPKSSLASTVAAVRAALDNAGLSAVEQHVTEWNTDATPARTQRDSPLAAAYVAAALSAFASGNVSVALFYPGCQGVGASSWGLFEDYGTGAALGLRPETHAYRAAGQTLRDTPWPAAASTPADATVLAGAGAPPKAGGLATNISIVVTTTAATYNSLSLSVNGLTPSTAFTLVTDVIDASYAGSPARRSAAVVAASDGTLAVSLAFAPPAVMRVQLLLVQG